MSDLETDTRVGNLEKRIEKLEDEFFGPKPTSDPNAPTDADREAARKVAAFDDRPSAIESDGTPREYSRDHNHG